MNLNRMHPAAAALAGGFLALAGAGLSFGAVALPVAGRTVLLVTGVLLILLAGACIGLSLALQKARPDRLRA